MLLPTCEFLLVQRDTDFSCFSSSKLHLRHKKSRPYRRNRLKRQQHDKQHPRPEVLTQRPRNHGDKRRHRRQSQHEQRTAEASLVQEKHVTDGRHRERFVRRSPNPLDHAARKKNPIRRFQRSSIEGRNADPRPNHPKHTGDQKLRAFPVFPREDRNERSTHFSKLTSIQLESIIHPRETAKRGGGTRRREKPTLRPRRSTTDTRTTVRRV